MFNKNNFLPILVLLCFGLLSFSGYAIGANDSDGFVKILTSQKNSKKSSFINVTYKPQKGYHIKPETPLELDFGKDSLSFFKKTKFGWNDVKNKKKRSKIIKIELIKKPQKTLILKGKTRVIACNDKSGTCHIIKRKLELKILP